MREITELKEIQSKILRIAIEFKSVMDKHDIPYYMIGGTMLGAIRHGGFIPWDDDMDFGIPRSYYEQAVEILNTELKKPYRIITSEQGMTLCDTSKIEDFSTEIVEESRNKNLKRTGLFIDIFPIDKCNSKTGLFSRNRLISKLMVFNRLKYVKKRTNNNWLLWRVVRLLPRNTMLKLARMLLFKKGNCMTNYSGLYGSKEIMPQEYYGIPTLYNFEDTNFYGVEKYDYYLKHVYGDYMKLPPKEKQHTHISACFVSE